jgi:hypothetical protein
MLIAIPRVTSGYIVPQYSMADSSRDLGNLLSSHSTISTIKAEGLFNNNFLRYRSGVNWSMEKPEVVVVAFTDVKQIRMLHEEYHLAKTYRLLVPPARHWSRAKSLSNDGEGVIVSVYMRNVAGRDERVRHLEGKSGATGNQ